MAEIQVRPDDLNAYAEQARQHATRIQAAIDIVDEQILVRMGPGVFTGNRPDMLRGRYTQMQETLDNFRTMIMLFADKLDQAAADFRAADTTS